MLKKLPTLQHIVGMRWSIYNFFGHFSQIMLNTTSQDQLHVLLLDVNRNIQNIVKGHLSIKNAPNTSEVSATPSTVVEHSPKTLSHATAAKIGGKMPVSLTCVFRKKCTRIIFKLHDFLTSLPPK